MTNPRAPRAVLARAAAGILSLGLAAAVAGCAGTASVDPKPAAGQTAPAKASASPSPVAKSYGDVIGSGKQVKTSDGSYETIALPADSPLYRSVAGQGVTSAGYSKEDAAAAQKLVADYMATQFFDSTALEAKGAGAADWNRSNASKWFTADVQSDLATRPLQVGQVVLGDLTDSNAMPPALVHDGKPRVTSADLKFANVAPFDRNGGKGIEYDVTYSVSYRVPAAAAAAFAASRHHETAQQFLASVDATPKIKAKETTEVTYVLSGTASFVTVKQQAGTWLIGGFKSTTDYDMGDFASTSSN